MTLQAVEQARAAYRERHITQHYSSPLRLATTVSVSLLIASLSAMVLKDVSPLEWLTIPLTFLYANLTEYLGHKGPMHHKTRFFSPIFEHHSIQHHAFFAYKSLTYDTTQDFKAVLFPTNLLLFFNGCFALPVGALLYLLVLPNISFLFVLTAILYFLNYELLHFAYHMDPQSWVDRLPFMNRLRAHHSYHHDRRLMTRYNFNITYPLCDYLFGTVYKGSN